ncbi:hypothetical protein GF380_05515 [Candidatus Uhrbacteria bacterium]|nr:hypothetical protein [Candidatus Uhrbacteria bacterium]
MIVTFTGASGSGKTTIANAILERVPSAQLLTSNTTRNPRPTALPRVDSYLDRERFEQMEADGHFLWTAGLAETRSGRAETCWITPCASTRSGL